MTEHHIRYQRNTITGEWCASCTCCRAKFGTEAEVKTWAATHDLEWVDVPATEPKREPADA